VSLLMALLINILLFALMQQMVAGRQIDLHSSDALLIDFIRTPDRSETTPHRRVRKSPPKPPEPPEQLVRQIQPAPEAVKQPLPMPVPILKIDMPLVTTIEVGVPYLGPVQAKVPVKVTAPVKATTPIRVEAPVSEVPEFVMAHDLTSVLRSAPRYPRAMRRKGINGHVMVEFTVTEKGLVQNPVILKSHPHDIFGKSVMRTVQRWKFRPYRKDGRPIAVRARQRVDFLLE